LPVDERNISGLNTLFGGSAIAAAVGATEAASGRSLVWCTAQFLSQAKPGEVLIVDVDLRAEGRSMTQALIHGHVDGRAVIDVMAALGEREFPVEDTWVTMPDVPGPDESPDRVWNSPLKTVSSEWRRRIAVGRVEWDSSEPVSDGWSAMWVDTRTDGRVDAALLALLGDHVPFGIHQATPGSFSISSLDNTIRVVDVADSDWLLIEMKAHSLRRGIGQGHLHIWTRDGRLLATASQSCQLRSF